MRNVRHIKQTSIISLLITGCEDGAEQIKPVDFVMMMTHRQTAYKDLASPGEGRFGEIRLHSFGIILGIEFCLCNNQNAIINECDEFLLDR